MKIANRLETSRGIDDILSTFARDLQDLRDIERTEIVVSKAVEKFKAEHPLGTAEEFAEFIANGAK